jgi:hypothetical protein
VTQVWNTAAPGDLTPPVRVADFVPPRGLAASGPTVALAGTFRLTESSWAIATTAFDSVTGAIRWTDRYQGPFGGRDTAAAAVVDAAGNVFTVGTSPTGPGSADLVIIKYTAAGARQWVVRYNNTAVPSGLNTGVAAALDAQSNLVVAGQSANSAGGTDIVVLKYNQSGVRNWVARYSRRSTPPALEGPTGIAVDGSSNVFVTGSSTIRYTAGGAQVWVANFTSRAADDLAIDATGNVITAGGDSKITRFGLASGLVTWSVPAPAAWRMAITTDAASAAYVAYPALLPPPAAGTGASLPISGYGVMKLDGSGATVWTKGGAPLATAGAHAVSVVGDAVGNIFVCHPLSGGPAPYYPGFMVTKLDGDGTLIWRAVNSAYAAPGPDGPGKPDLQAVSRVYPNVVVDAGLNVHSAAWVGAVGPVVQKLSQSGRQNDSLAPDSIGDALASLRVYSPVTLEHLITTDANEYETLGSAGWSQEGPLGRITDGPVIYNGVRPVTLYRAYSPTTQKHLYTTNFNEYFNLGLNGWVKEGFVGFLWSAGGPGGLVPLYRLYLPDRQLHLLTVDANEYAVLPSIGWNAEGVVGYMLLYGE